MTFAVEALLQLVREGKIRLPEFQRPQRWRASHVLELFDSIERGFPIGTFVFARREAEAKTLRFGPLEIRAPRVAEGLFVVDGQQRMSALAGALLHPSERPRGDLHALWFDLEEDRFVCNLTGIAPSHWIPLNVVVDPLRLLTWLNEWPLRGERPDLVRRALALGQAIRDYPVPVCVVDGTSEDVLRLVFRRMNRAGAAMQEHEVFEALWGGGHPLRAVLGRLAETGFGDIGEECLLRSVEAVACANSRIVADAVEATETALRRVIAFLVGWAGIPHEQLLPYRLPLPILARFFHLYPEPDPRVFALLVRWVWRGALSGVHADTSDGTLGELQAKIATDADCSAERLLAAVPRMVEFPSALDEWNGGDAQTRLCALALFHLGARDPETGREFDVEAVQDLLRQRGSLDDAYCKVYAPSGENLVAHRFLVAKPTRLTQLLDAPDDVLQSHGLDVEAVAAYQRGDLRGFTERRSRLLDDAFKRFFRERAALGESDRPSIAAILRRVEESAA